ncbi:lipopolysaccharide biosynthesis protein [Devosia nitrariae]|uniref:Polysaccharide export related protein n=1 Tax=Devosia nitrariae TaxID=2071872 RepID=A0ABQ5W438_9HYPH|nr:polysaccharide biosynthesis C-terminal domain-containing protein [Devosia nitrariae]GLQ54618.1 polysaccharide export related protein [Devosia nitrariae]
MSLYRRLASQSSVIFAARLFGAGIVFVVQALIARTWGADILGEYLVIIATVNLVAVTMPLGFQTIGGYFAAEYRAHGNRRQLVAFLARAYGHIALVFAVLLVAGQPLLSLFGLGQGTVARHFLPVMLLAFGTTMVFVNGAVLVGMKRPFAGFFADTLFRPMIVIAGFAAAAAIADADAAFTALLWWVACGYVAICLIHFGFVVATVLAVADEGTASTREPRRWWRFALPWVVIGLATDFFFDIDLLLLAALLSREELAIFGVCTRVFSLVSFGVAAVYAVTMPEMFESEARQDRAGFNRKVSEANLVAGGLSVFLFVVMLIAGPFALMLFGPAFSAGAVPLAILCLALVVRSLLGPASLVLSIHDRPYASLPAVGLGVVTLVGGNFLLVPAFGLMGAALAALFAISLWSGALWWTALKTAKVDVSIFQRWRRTIERATPAE